MFFWILYIYLKKNICIFRYPMCSSNIKFDISQKMSTFETWFHASLLHTSGLVLELLSSLYTLLNNAQTYWTSLCCSHYKSHASLNKNKLSITVVELEIWLETAPTKGKQSLRRETGSSSRGRNTGPAVDRPIIGPMKFPSTKARYKGYLRTNFSPWGGRGRIKGLFLHFRTNLNA